MTFIIKGALEPETPPTVFGVVPLVVLSGSMEPEISLYDLVIIHEKDSYEVGDVQNFLQTPAGFLLLTLAAGFFLLAPEWIARKKTSSAAKAAPSPEGKAINSSSAAKAAPSPKGKAINQKKGR